MVRLKEICNVDWGNTNLTKAAYTEGGEYLGVSATGCDGKFNYYDFEAYTPVISAIGANCGKMFLPPKNFVAIKNTITLVPHDCVDGKYLYYAMINNRIPKRGGGQPFISKSDTENYEIPCPSLSTQREIIRIFDILSSTIKSRQQQIQKLDELVKSRFVELFGNPVNNSMGLKTIPLGKACCLKAGITTPADMIHEQSNKFSVPCYGGNGIRGYVESATQSGCYPIIGRQGALCGNVQLATGRFHATEHAVLVTPLIETNVVWLFYLLKMMDLYRFHTGAAQPGLAVKTLNTVDIPIADVTMQHQFAIFVEQVDKSKVVAQKALDKAKLLFNGLMQKYFG